MAGSINKVILVGNLGRDPDVRSMPNGDPVANFSVATSERWTDRESGEQRERTEWHRVVIFGKLASIAERYLHKGSKVYLEGQLRTRKWQDQSGQDRYSTEVVLRSFNGAMVMLDSRGGGGAPPPSDDGDIGYGEQSGGSSGAPAGNGQGGSDAGAADFDDDIPF